jgi:hypothetical protein
MNGSGKYPAIDSRIKGNRNEAGKKLERSRKEARNQKQRTDARNGNEELKQEMEARKR